MRNYLKIFAFALLPLVMMAVTGCGGSGSSNSSNDIFSKTPTQPTDPVFPNLSTASGKPTLTLTTDVPSVDVDNGQVLAIAKVKSGEAVLAGVPVTFTVTPSALATIETKTVTTDSNGSAITRITTGHVSSTTNLLVTATIGSGTQTVIANHSFQIVRGGGVLMFSSNAGITPGGQSNVITPSTKTVPPDSGPWTFFQLLPFKLTDSNGNPWVGVPVSISVYSLTTTDPREGVTVDFLTSSATEPAPNTITTDSAGQGIFSAAITMLSPPPNGANVVNVVWKAVTAVPNDPFPVSAYVGGTYTLEAKVSTVTVSPSSGTFGSSLDLTFAISGGTKPFNVSSNNPSRVTAALQGDNTITAHLVDTSQWTGTVNITVSDSAGQVATVALQR